MRNHTHTLRHCLRRCSRTFSSQLPSSLRSSPTLSFLLLVVRPYRPHHWSQETLDHVAEIVCLEQSQVVDPSMNISSELLLARASAVQKPIHAACRTFLEVVDI